MIDVFAAIAIGLGAGAAAFFGALLLRPSRHSVPEVAAALAPVPERTEILLTGPRVIDMTASARQMVDCAVAEPLDWTDLVCALTPLFGPLPDQPPQEETILTSEGNPDLRLVISPQGPDLRLTVSGPPLGLGAQLRLQADRADLDRLRRTMALVPCPIWQSSDSGQTLWHNAAFEDICAQMGCAADGPCPFDLLPAEDEDTQVTRVSAPDLQTGGTLWFEVQSHRVPEGWLHVALSIDAIITSEMSQRNFLQTLTRIFAHLPIGLAVFDKERRLVLFNPALIDLTALPADFLSVRPNLLSFFDMLRDKRMMPEPKNYQNWRDKLGDLIAAASSDLYIETWNLPSGLTYKITGRPHPDGGIAFLFEDISAEVSLTRRFRQEIETSHAVLDCLDDAIAVFSQMGVLSFCNEAYRDLWNSDPDITLTETGVTDATRLWQAQCRPTPVWGDLRDFVLNLTDRAIWDAELDLLCGQRLICRVEPVAGGATLVRFSRIGAVVPHSEPSLHDA